MTVPDPRIADLDVRLPAPEANMSWPQQGGAPGHSMQHVDLADAPEVVWQADIGAGSDDDAPILSGPVVAAGQVIAMDAAATVSAFSAVDGARAWRVALAPRGEREGSWGGGVAFSDGQVYVATGFAQVVSLDAKTGEELWRQPVSGPMRAAPTVVGDRVFVVTHDNQLHALDAANGELLWTHTGIVEAAGLLGGASPAAADDIVVVPYSSGAIFALRVENGRAVWSDSLAAIRRVDAVS
ncbi:MAG: PQQ-binding-like beta-propeller repeat protein, partial [bacterium]|nr:PQQ-binding-like beta-propeller repeat protein [bacterium]